MLSMPKAFRQTSVLVYPEKERLAHLRIEYVSLYKICLYMAEVWIYLAHSICCWRHEILEAKFWDIYIVYLMETHGFVGGMQGLNLALKLTVTLGSVKYAFNAKINRIEGGGGVK